MHKLGLNYCYGFTDGGLLHTFHTAFILLLYIFISLKREPFPVGKKTNIGIKKFRNFRQITLKTHEGYKLKHIFYSVIKYEMHTG